MSETIESRIEMVVEQVDELDLDEAYIEDRLHEIADGTVPVYHSDILDVASSDYSLLTSTPEIGPAFDGEPTPVNIAAANIYERLYAAAADRLREREEEEGSTNMRTNW